MKAICISTLPILITLFANPQFSFASDDTRLMSESKIAQMTAQSSQTHALIVKFNNKSITPTQSGTKSTLSQIDKSRIGFESNLTAHGYSPKSGSIYGFPNHVLIDLGHNITLDDAKNLALEAKKDPNIEYIEPDTWLNLQSIPNDPGYAAQWYLYESTGGIGEPSGWKMEPPAGVNSQPVRVAILDNGVYQYNSDMGYGTTTFGALYSPNGGTVNGICSNGKPPITPYSYHGTRINGIINATTNNSFGISGIGWGYPIKTYHYWVLSDCGGTLSNLILGINAATNDSIYGKTVINISEGTQLGTCPQSLQDAINGASAKGIPVVVAAGNFNSDVSTTYPANCQNVIAVAATGRYGGRAWYSNYGSAIALAAPGGDTNHGANPSNGIYSANSAFDYAEGTSFSAPQVTAAIAVMMTLNPSLTTDQILNVLKTTARSFPASCSGCGAGILNIPAALLAIGARPTSSIPPNQCQVNPSMCI